MRRTSPDRRIRRLLAALLAVAISAGFAPVVGVVTAGAIAAAASGSGSTAQTPRNNVAAIYNEFGLSPDDATLLGGLTDRLRSEGYDVTRYEDTTEGAGSRGTATLKNFVGMAKTASVIIVNGHGEDFSGTSQSCTVGKGVSFVPCAAVPGTPTPTASGRAPKPQPVLQVEWYPTWQAEIAAYRSYLAQGYNPNWLYNPVLPNGVYWASTLVPWRPGDAVPDNAPQPPNYTGEGLRPWLGITAAGIAHFFKGHDIGLVDVLDCHSVVMAPSFGARAFFGHANRACIQFEANDEITLFDRLTGNSGVPQRTTDAAYSAGGFNDKFFKLAPGSKPLVLSPAVESVTPKAGALAKPGTTTTATVRFDAAMDDSSPAGVVTVSGCGASIVKPKWSGASALSFGVKVPKDPPGRSMTVTVHHEKAEAAPGGSDNQQLDGDGQPADDSGLAPNRDDYTYRLACSNQADSVVKITSVGTFASDWSGLGAAYHQTFTWTETRSFDVAFVDGQFESKPVDDGAVTASGSAHLTGGGAAGDDCTWSVAPKPNVLAIVQSGQQLEAGSKRTRTIDVQAPMPSATDDLAGPAGSGQLVHSGQCGQNSVGGPTPYLHQNPSGGPYDPGSFLQTLQAGEVKGIDFDKLATTPSVTQFPVDYTQTDDSGGTEHVVAHATVTVSSG